MLPESPRPGHFRRYNFSSPRAYTLKISRYVDPGQFLQNGYNIAVTVMFPVPHYAPVVCHTAFTSALINCQGMVDRGSRRGSRLAQDETKIKACPLIIKILDFSGLLPMLRSDWYNELLLGYML